MKTLCLNNAHDLSHDFHRVYNGLLKVFFLNFFPILVDECSVVISYIYENLQVQSKQQIWSFVLTLKFTGDSIHKQKEPFHL